MLHPPRQIFTWIAVALALAGSSAWAQYTAVHVPIGPHNAIVSLHLYVFDAREWTFKVIDQGEPSMETYSNLDAAMTAHKCEAGCNGGPFDREGNPRGLVIADGVRSGDLATEGTVNAGVLFVQDRQPRLTTTSAFRARGNLEPRQLLQAGPLLVENGKPAPGLSLRRVARRSFVFTDGKHRWAIGYAPATTLHQLALALADPKTFKTFNVATALNLDGGSSSGIWFKRKHGPLYLHELRPVRNFVGIVRR